ncbi:threonine/homoserine efflux transporter RhtA [Chitinophaga skermanii]|uniref:Threonine/homoserine efflux transporter RhtA n=1 Tax=Chitinophaga skermanii TaxID=331697 RepID=A0A327R219_9BACT|nr:DMT family transporter [Chitinophaga skermanii]RAJ10846.1 threonine/homoserine efflux transporter RhtA [Chitinophaga skermanii]
MWKGALLVFAGACSFGILSTIVKSAYKLGYTLTELCGIQAGLGMIFLWAIYLLTRDKKTPIQWRNGLKLLALGTSSGIVSITYYQSVQYIPASVAILLLMQFTWMNMLVDAILHKKRPTVQQLICVGLILCGTILASGMLNGVNSHLPVAGIGFGLLAAAFYTVFMTANSSTRSNTPPVLKSAWMVTGAFLIVSLILPPTYLFNGRLFDSTLLLWGLPLALFGTVLPPFLYAKGMPQVGLSLGGIISAAELPVAVVSAAIVLREQVGWMQIAGIVLILGAITWSNYPKKAGIKSPTV